MPRVCTLCNHAQRAEIDRELLAGTSFRNIAERCGTSIAAVSRHKPHIAQSMAVAERETGPGAQAGRNGCATRLHVLGGCGRVPVNHSARADRRAGVFTHQKKKGGHGSFSTR